jgi:glutathione S-transferase
VLLTLEVKQLPYQSKLLTFSKREHKAPAYLALNPRGKVPTLKDGDFVLYESLAIIAYLDIEYPERPIFGFTPREIGTIGRLISENISYVCDPIGKVVGPLLFGSTAEKEAEIQAAATTVYPELARLEATVAKSPWLAGIAISAADIVVYPWMQMLLRAARKEATKPLNLKLLPFNVRYPHLAAWVKGIEAIPGYERTYLPHWR